MKTTATNRKIRVLLTDIRNGILIPKPEFQRRLVWTNKDKKSFLKTVLGGYPFPEIYIAAGEVNPDTGEGKEMLVDGQQRITTLYQYFISSGDINLGKEILPYSKLSEKEKIEFLEYEVVVRDLGQMSIKEIKEIFQKINSTTYALNAMEINNARYNGEFKIFAEKLSQHDFFEKNRVFSAAEIRRMQDVQFLLVFIVTIMSTYFNRNDELETYLDNYNDEFEIKDDLNKDIEKVFDFIRSCNFALNCRVWKKADLSTLLVELYRALIKNKRDLEEGTVCKCLKQFYDYIDTSNVEKDFAMDFTSEQKVVVQAVNDYHKAAMQATNDRSSRIRRGETIQKIIEGELNLSIIAPI